MHFIGISTNHRMHDAYISPEFVPSTSCARYMSYFAAAKRICFARKKKRCRADVSCMCVTPRLDLGVFFLYFLERPGCLFTRVACLVI